MHFAIRGELSPRRDLVIGATGLLLLVGAWCVLTYGGFVREIFLPKPSSL